jgi:GNAT superfamily N-acetyltransferase
MNDYNAARALYAVLAAGSSLPDGEQGRTAFATLLAHPGTSVIGACREEQIVSMATLNILPNMTYQARPYGVVENVATLPAFEGQGFGKMVMHAVAEAAWRADAYKIMLLSGRANKAEGFYRALGYDADEKHGFILRSRNDR